MNDFFEFIQTHKAHSAPLLIAGFFAITIILERVKTLFSTFPMHSSVRFFEKISSMILADKLSEAIALCERYRTKPIAKVVKEALLRAHQPEEIIENGLELAVAEQLQRIAKRTAFLGTIANLSVLLGLFGTVAGLVTSFQAVANADPAIKTTMLTVGISTAMNATMMGLAIAIPCMIAFAILTNKSNAITADVEQSAIRIMDLLRQRYYSLESERISQKGGFSKAV
jgi:biopolymer transport protein ExbB/TolQ